MEQTALKMIRERLEAPISRDEREFLVRIVHRLVAEAAERNAVNSAEGWRQENLRPRFDSWGQFDGYHAN